MVDVLHRSWWERRKPSAGLRYVRALLIYIRYICAMGKKEAISALVWPASRMFWLQGTIFFPHPPTCWVCLWKCLWKEVCALNKTKNHTCCWVLWTWHQLIQLRLRCEIGNIWRRRVDEFSTEFMKFTVCTFNWTQTVPSRLQIVSKRGIVSSMSVAIWRTVYLRSCPYSQTNPYQTEYKP